jgi:hypothetical protein
MSATAIYRPPQEVAGLGRSAQDRVKHYDLAISVARRAGEPDVASLLGALRDIARRHPDSASVWPSQKLLAAQLGRSVRTVRRWITRAQQLGLLNRARQWVRRVDGVCTGKASRYWLAPFRAIRARLKGQNRMSDRPDTYGRSLPLQREGHRAPADAGVPDEVPDRSVDDNDTPVSRERGLELLAKLRDDWQQRTRKP